MIQISNLSKRFNSDVIFEKAELKIKSPGMYFILAPSGMGKSTLLNMIAGYEPYDEGKIEYDGSLAYIDQEYHLIDELIVLDNIYLGLEKKDSDKELFKELGIITLLNRYPKELSGGQRQRLALARALLHDSAIYIFDEATSNIDMESEEAIMSVIHNLNDKTIILISHRLANVISSDMIITMEDGKIKESGTHEELLKKKGLYQKLYLKQYSYEKYMMEGIS